MCQSDRPWKCFFGLHTWTKWDKVSVIERTYQHHHERPFKGTVGYIYQKECTVCGIPKFKKVYTI